MVIQYR